MDLLIGGGKAHAAVAVALIFIRSVRVRRARHLHAVCKRLARLQSSQAGRARSPPDDMSFDNGVDTVEKSSFLWPLIVSEAMRVSVFSLLCLRCVMYERVGDNKCEIGLHSDTQT